MKIKLLSLLLAISLTVGLLPITMVNAETSATDAPASATTSAPTPAVTSPSATVTQPATTLPTTTAPTLSEPTSATTPNFDSVSLSVKLCENSATQDYSVILTATKGGKAVYATTNDSGTPTLVTGNAVPNNKYVKFEYPQNGLPTITLMNARLRSTGNVLDLSSFDAPVKIVIAGDSTIESTNANGIYRASYGDITILGPKNLTMNCYNSAIAFSADSYTNSLTLKDLKLKATAYANADGHTLQIPAGNLTIDSCNIELVNRAGVCVYLGHGNVSGLGSAMISNSVFSATSQNTAFKLSGNLSIFDSNAQFSSDTQALLCGKNLSLNGSTLYMTGRSNAKETVDVRGDFTLRTSNAEIIGTRFAIFSSTTLPKTLSEHTVVAGITKNTTTSFIEDFVEAYQYYYAESQEQLTDPTDPTVIETDPTETDPTETDPTETDPTGTDSTETDPTDFFTDPTVEPTEDTIAPPESTLPPLPTPTLPVNSTAKKSGTMFWILAALMVLGACGAVTMAIIMFRRSAEEEYEDEWDETPEENTSREFEENSDDESHGDIDEKPKKFSIEKLKIFFAKKSKEDNLEEDFSAENEESTHEEPAEESFEEPQQGITEEDLESIIQEFHEDPIGESQEDMPQSSIEDTAEKPKKFSMEKIKMFFLKIIEETTADDFEEDSEN